MPVEKAGRSPLWLVDKAAEQNGHPPTRQDVEAQEALIVELSGARVIANVKTTEVTPQQIVKHRFGTAMLDLVREGGEIGAVAAAVIADPERRPAATGARGIDCPITVRRNDDMQVIESLKRVFIFILNANFFVRHKTFQITFKLPIAGPAGLVEVEQDQPMHVGIELTAQLIGVMEMETVGAEDSEQRLDEQPLAEPLGVVTENQRNLAVTFGMLKHVRRPVEDVIVDLAVASGQDVIDVILHQ